MRRFPHMSSRKSPCEFCGANTSTHKDSKPCTACRRVVYCSVGCQRAGWAAHAKKCAESLTPACAVGDEGKVPGSEPITLTTGIDIETQVAASASGRVAGMSVKELKKLITHAGLSHADCVEKSELRERGAEALEKLNTRALMVLEEAGQKWAAQNGGIEAATETMRHSFGESAAVESGGSSGQQDPRIMCNNLYGIPGLSVLFQDVDDNRTFSEAYVDILEKSRGKWKRERGRGKLLKAGVK